MPELSLRIDIASMHDRPSDSAASGSLAGYEGGRAVPPPPAGPSLASRQHDGSADTSLPAYLATPSTPSSGSTGNSKVFPFDAELEMAESEHGKAGMPWIARARTLSTSSLSLSSRRMCYVDRRVIVAVHRMDSTPMMLLGRVADCRYETDGLYTIDLELLPTDDADVKVSFSRKAM